MKDNLEVFVCSEPFIEVFWCHYKPFCLRIELLRNVLRPLVLSPARNVFSLQTVANLSFDLTTTVVGRKIVPEFREELQGTPASGTQRPEALWDSTYPR